MNLIFYNKHGTNANSKMLLGEFKVKLKTFIKSHTKSPYIFTNKKTSGVSVDFGICGFMKPNKEGNLTSKACPGCYSARILNIYNMTREKLISNGIHRNSLTGDQVQNDIDNFESDIKELVKFGITKLRFYGLGDFSYKDMPYIIAASKHLTVDIISKTLNLPINEFYLLRLNNMKNVWISLSFNFKFNNEFERIKKFLKDNKSRNIQLNWTINYKNQIEREDPRIQDVQVIHVTNNDKRGALEYGFKETNVCGVFDGDGNRTVKGICDSCNNCHISFLASQRGKHAKLPTILVA